MLIARSSHEGKPGQRRGVNVLNVSKDVTGVCIEHTGEQEAVGNGYAKAMHFWLPTFVHTVVPGGSRARAWQIYLPRLVCSSRKIGYSDAQYCFTCHTDNYIGEFLDCFDDHTDTLSA